MNLLNKLDTAFYKDISTVKSFLSFIYFNNNNGTFEFGRLILKRAFGIFLLTFYTLGTFCLPLGDFAFLQEIPEIIVIVKPPKTKIFHHLILSPIIF
jgi:hypothetical protein